MNRPELYQKTVDALLDAYNKNNLRHGDCTACAVGNICTDAAQGLGLQSSDWHYRFTMDTDTGVQELNVHGLSSDDPALEKADKLIQASGYQQEELMIIEKVFENSIRHPIKNYLSLMYENEKKGQFIGLCAVLDVLQEIHEVDKYQHEESKKNLEKIYQSKVLIAE